MNLSRKRPVDAAHRVRCVSALMANSGRGWSHRVAALLSIWALAACYGGAPDEMAADVPEAGGGADDLGLGVDFSESVELPGCEEEGEPDLVAGFSLAREVDYVADRVGTQVLSADGEPCSGAPDEALCQGALASIISPFRHLVTTEGGAVRIWQGESAIGLFGQLDLAEAAWLASAFDYRVPCGARVARVFDLILIDGAEALWGCATPQARVTLSISPEGFVNELRLVTLDNAVCEPGLAPGGFGVSMPAAAPPIPVP